MEEFNLTIDDLMATPLPDERILDLVRAENALAMATHAFTYKRAETLAAIDTYVVASPYFDQDRVCKIRKHVVIYYDFIEAKIPGVHDGMTFGELSGNQALRDHNQQRETFYRDNIKPYYERTRVAIKEKLGTVVDLKNWVGVRERLLALEKAGSHAS